MMDWRGGVGTALPHDGDSCQQFSCLLNRGGGKLARDMSTWGDMEQPARREYGHNLIWS